jgi:hypothetical protein
MQRSTTNSAATDFVLTHPLDPKDAPTVAAMRAMARMSRGISFRMTLKKGDQKVRKVGVVQGLYGWLTTQSGANQSPPQIPC